MSKICMMAAAAMAALIGLLVAPPASAQQLPAELQNPNVESVYKEPLRLPRKLTINVDECGAPMREYQPQGPVVICYEVIDQIEKIAAKADANVRERVLV